MLPKSIYRLKWQRANWRYEWFEKIKKESGAAVIAVAHHRDDSVETLLLNLIRGTGINGLLGIRARNGDVVRPLLLHQPPGGSRLPEQHRSALCNRQHQSARRIHPQ